MTDASSKIIIAHVSGTRGATQIRSTVLQSSVSSLRERGHFERWLTLVDLQYRATIVESLAPSWLPIEVALAHYTACEALMLPQTEQSAMGAAVGDRIQGTFLGTLMKSARAAGFNPMVLLSQFDRLYARLFQGGSVQLTQTGPKDMDIELRGNALCDYSYFRMAFAGVVRAGILLAGVRSSYVKPVRFNQATSTYVMHASWA
ncbi:MAG: hypothetical protein JWN04_3120 [Myxococcaceae bacterium]|nr:hypothetical protein [Myxococcaceae bacterium]